MRSFPRNALVLVEGGRSCDLLPCTCVLAKPTYPHATATGITCLTHTHHFLSLSLTIQPSPRKAFSLSLTLSLYLPPSTQLGSVSLFHLYKHTHCICPMIYVQLQVQLFASQFLLPDEIRVAGFPANCSVFHFSSVTFAHFSYRFLSSVRISPPCLVV